MKKALQYIALVLLMLLVAMPGLQMRFEIFKERPLNGAFKLADRAAFSKSGWDSGEFQDQVEKYLKDHAGFRNFMVRLYNQVDYSIYRKANAEGAVIGKQRQLYEYDYIRSWLGIDNPGESFITKKLDRAKYVQDYLKREKGIDLIIVFEPGKASFYPEFIPERYQELKHGPSTYDLYAQKAREVGISFTDWQAYFLKMKPSSKFPLFPEFGTHWSDYGMTFAADSMLNIIRQRRNINPGSLVIDSIEISRKARDTDDDVARTMNLMFEPIGEKLAYPVISFDTSGNIEKPRVLVIADSFYWNIFNTKIPKYLFANQAFWYFNELVYPEYYTTYLHTASLDLKKEVEDIDVIFLMVTERFVHKFDWTFIDELYKLYTPEWLRDPVYDNINQIMKYAPWYNDIISKAEKKGISLEKALIQDATFMYFENDTAGFMIRNGKDYYRRLISEDQEWMNGVRNRAAEKGISEKKMLDTEALYAFQQRYPNYYDYYLGVKATEQEIRSDPAMMDSINRLSRTYLFDHDQMLWLVASREFRKKEISRISEVIRNDPAWLEHVRKKSIEREIPLDEMIHLDAIYMYEQKLR